MISSRQIIAHIDALGCQIKLGMTTDGNVMAKVNEVSIKDESVLISCCGYGHDAEAAILDLWLKITALKPHQYLMVSTPWWRRIMKWNGIAFKDRTLDFPAADDPIPQEAQPSTAGGEL